MATYGYARVSTNGQELNEQIEQLKQNGVIEANIFFEKFTGTTTKRPQFNKLIESLVPGDSIVVTKLDRFARNTREALDTIEPLLKQDIHIRVLNLGTIENTPMSKMIMRTLLSVAEMERDMIMERTNAGKEYAKSHNPHYREGRPKRTITPHYRAISEYAQSHTYTETAAAFNVSKSTVYRIIKQIKSEEN